MYTCGDRIKRRADKKNKMLRKSKHETGEGETKHFSETYVQMCTI